MWDFVYYFIVLNRPPPTFPPNPASPLGGLVTSPGASFSQRGISSPNSAACALPPQANTPPPLNEDLQGGWNELEGARRVEGLHRVEKETSCDQDQAWP